jgi:DNA repair protein RadC
MRYPTHRETLAVPNPLEVAPARSTDPFGLRRSAHLAPVHRTPPLRSPALSTPEKAAHFLAGLGALPQEQFVVVPLNTRNVPLSAVVVHKGTANDSIVHPREVLAPVLEARATAFLVAHNHPSGDCTPSLADEVVTKRLAAAGRLVGVPLVDHLVVGYGCHHSLRQHAESLFEDPGEVIRSNAGGRMRRKRNPPLTARQARALCAVVRRHGKRCGNPLTRREQAKILVEARRAARQAAEAFARGDVNRSKAMRFYGDGLMRAMHITGKHVGRYLYLTPQRRTKVSIQRCGRVGARRPSKMIRRRRKARR